MVGINEAKIVENITAKVLYNNWTYTQLRIEAQTGVYHWILCSRCFEQRRGEVTNIFWEITFARRRGEAPMGIQPKATPWVWM